MAAYFQTDVREMDYNLSFADFGRLSPNNEAWVEWNLRKVCQYIDSGDARGAQVYARELTHWATLPHERISY